MALSSVVVFGVMFGAQKNSGSGFTEKHFSITLKLPGSLQIKNFPESCQRRLMYA